MHNPFVPETLEGWSVLHLMFRVDWRRLKERTLGEREQLGRSAIGGLTGSPQSVADGATAFVQLLGHKGDLMLVLFRRTFDDLGRAELALAQTPLAGYLIP